MHDFILVSAFYAIPLIAAVVVFFTAPRKIAFFSPVFLFLIYHIVFSAGSSLHVYFETSSARPVLVPTFFAVCYAAGAVLASSLFARFFRYRERILIYGLNESDKSLSKMIVVAGVLAIVLYYYMSGVVPMAELFSSSDRGMHEARRAITYAHRDAEVRYFGQGYFKVVFSVFLPIAVATLAINRRLTHGDWSVYYLLILLVILAQALSGQIWPAMLCAAFFVITLLAAGSYRLKKEKSIYKSSLKLMFIFLSLVAIFFAFRWIQYIGGRIFSTGVFESAFERLFFVKHAWLYVLFPAEHDYRLGMTWINDVLGFLPGSREMFAYEVHHLVNGGAWGFTMYPSIFASAYVNFGVLWGGFALGLMAFVVQSTFFTLLRRASEPFFLVLATYFTTYQMYAAKADITSVVFPYLVIGLLLLAYKANGVIREKVK